MQVLHVATPTGCHAYRMRKTEQNHPFPCSIYRLLCDSIEFSYVAAITVMVSSPRASAYNVRLLTTLH